MTSPESLRRIATLTKKVRDDLRSGGMGVTFRYLFRSTTILARVVEILADHVATEAEIRRNGGQIGKTAPADVAAALKRTPAPADS